MPKKTSLYDAHVALNGHMVNFAGFMLPVRYESEMKEHQAVRKNVGLFDISHMGEFFVYGPDATKFLQKVLTNNIENLDPGQAQYTMLLNEQAGIIDDLIVYRLEDKFLLCVNASNIEKDFLWLRSQSSKFQVKLEDVSDKFALIALQGPKAIEVIKSITSDELPQKFAQKRIYLNGIESLVANTGYTGELGFEIFVNEQEANALWQLLLERGKDFGIKPCGLSSRDSLRLEAGLLLWGQDMDEHISPLEAGLMFAVDLEKDFIGKSSLLLKKEQGPQKKLMGFYLKDAGIARHENPVLDQQLKPIGVVTSGTYLPESKKAFGFLYINPSAKVDQEVLIDIRGRHVKAQIVKPKFLSLGAS